MYSEAPALYKKRNQNELRPLKNAVYKKVNYTSSIERDEQLLSGICSEHLKFERKVKNPLKYCWFAPY